MHGNGIKRMRCLFLRNIQLFLITKICFKRAAASVEKIEMLLLIFLPILDLKAVYRPITSPTFWFIIRIVYSPVFVIWSLHLVFQLAPPWPILPKNRTYRPISYSFPILNFFVTLVSKESCIKFENSNRADAPLHEKLASIMWDGSFCYYTYGGNWS